MGADVRVGWTREFADKASKGRVSALGSVAAHRAGVRQGVGAV